jgi:magnesium-protoporphyrin O-methyltransferase
MYSISYRQRRGQLQTYFDRTASDAWKRLTSDAPVSRIRATVRAGRDDMRAALLSFMPEDLSGRRLLDAGCGTGALAIEAARRGADVVAIDIAASLVDLARTRAADALLGAPAGKIEFLVGDMLDPVHGQFDHVVAMDSLIHYQTPDMVQMVAALCARSTRSVAFTFAPRTKLLTVMHAAGRFFPKSDRAPAIEPVSTSHLKTALAAEPALAGWQAERGHRVDSGFYTSEALEMVAR